MLTTPGLPSVSIGPAWRFTVPMSRKRVVPEIVVMMAIDKTCEKVAIIQSLFALLADRDRVNDIVKMTPEEIAKVFTDAVVTQ
jgi:PTS system galactitol-specific IIA component